MKIRRKSINAGYAVDEILWVLDGGDNTWKTWGSAGPKKKSMSKEELIDALNAEGNNYIDVLITKNGENPDDYGYTEKIKGKFVKSGCTKKSVKSNKINKRRDITAAEDLNGMVIITSGKAYVEVDEDDYEQGEGAFVNGWDFEIGTQFNSAQELIDDIYEREPIFFNDINNYVVLDGSLQTDVTVNEFNDIPTAEEVEAWKRGEIQLYVAHLWLNLEVGMASHQMTEEEAESFGFSVY